MSIPLPFANNPIQVFAYEDFDYTISNPNLSLTLQNVSNTGGLNPSSLYFTKDGNNSYQFSVPGISNNLTPGTTESFTLRLNDASGNVVLTSSNTVSIGGGRLLDASGISLSNTTYTFYKNEPVSQTLGRPFRLVAPSFALNTPVSIPALPPGLTFVRVDSNIFDISGIPSVVVPNSNYQIIGVQSNGSKIVTTRMNIAVNNERLQVNLSGSSIIGGMQVGTAITPRVLTAIPPLGSSIVRYAFPTLPDGIVVKDFFGVTQLSPFFPSDPSFTMIIQGTPTSNAVNFFRSFDPSGAGIQYTVQANVGLLSNTQPFTFSFGETVLFDTPTLSNNYVGVPVDPSLNFFRAQTYFTSNVPIADISSSSLPAGVILTFLPGTGRATLSGTPTTAGSAAYTIKATNSNGFSSEITPTITISNDSVSFSSPVGVDLCYNFILSRPLTQFKDGYYTSNIQFTATAASGRAVSLSAPALAGTGLSLDSNGLLVGLPTTITPLTDLNVTATVSGSPATAIKTVKFAILNDTFDFSSIAVSNFDFIQNVPITPFQIPVTTLSGRNVSSYSQLGFPSGVTINPAGFVSGTPLSSSPTAGNVTISASTGYASGSIDFSYNLIPDSMIFIVDPTQYQYQAGQSIGSIDINGVTYSGTTVSNYDLSINPTYGMVINPINGVVSGTWTSGVPPSQLLPASCNFAVTALAGTLGGALPATLTADPVVSNAMLFVAYGNPTGEVDCNSWMYSTSTSNITQFSLTNVFSTKGFADIQFKNNAPDSNIILASSDTGVFRATRLNDFSFVSFPPSTLTSQQNQVSSLVNISGTSNWLAAGSRGTNIVEGAAVFTSSDDGLTWDTDNVRFITNESNQDMKTRDDGSNFSENPYLNGGIALKYSSGYNVLMAGGLYNGVDGPVMLRSTDLGSNWSTVNGEFAQECGYLNLDVSSMWIATGSDLYQTRTYAEGAPSGPPPFTSGPTNTIKYSTDQGSNWSNATGGFNMYGYELVYGNGTWLATGVTVNTPGPAYIVPELRFSIDGINWALADLSTNNLFYDSNTFPIVAPLRIGSMNFDGNYWNVLVNHQASTGGAYLKMFRHDASSSLASDWVEFDISSSLTPGFPEQNPDLRFLTFTPPKYLYSGDPPINITLSFETSTPGVGPTFTSPINRSFLKYQYIPITPIQISATGTGQIYFFVETTDLPPGLVFNRATGQITGKPARAGNDTVTIYAKDDLGVTSIVLQFTTIVPRVIRKQDGAGAYTSLLRQYTEVLGAQNARDNRALPSQERALGEFMSPEGPDVVTQTIDPKCRNPNC